MGRDREHGAAAARSMSQDLLHSATRNSRSEDKVSSVMRRRGRILYEDIKVEQDEEMQKVLTKFNQLAIQDHVDSAVNHALINQSRVLVNTLANLIKSVVDGSIAEHEERGSVYLPGGEFPNYRELKTSIGGGRFQDNNVMVSRSKQPPTSGVFGSNTMIPEKLAEILKSVIPGSTQPSATEPIARRPPVIPQPHTQQPSGQPIGSHTIRPQYCIQEPRTFSF